MVHEHVSAQSLRGVEQTSSQKNEPTSSHASSPDFLTGGGEMGERIRAKDWSKTPLGPVEKWPRSLKTIVRIMLTSRQPIWIGWGQDLIKLYNDPYKAIVGGKHPEALGQPASAVWHEIWPVISPRLHTAMQQNEGTYDEALLLIMQRHGYQEETYYTFSYSPVPGDEGDVDGIICANTDDTRRVIGERQVKLLRTLAAETTDVRTIKEACRLCAKSLEQNPYDIPFAMLYLLDQEQQTMYLAGTSGIQADHQAAPARVPLHSAAHWPFAEAMRNQKLCLIDDLEHLFAHLPSGAWSRSPHQAVAVPIAPSGQIGQSGLLIVGLNPFRLFDEEYQGFIDLVSGQIAASIGSAQAYEEERKRAEALAEIDRAKTLFFSNVSHEFRTPLTLMLGPIEETLAEQHSLSAEQRERMEILRRNALRLLKLVNTLLDFSRIEAGRIQATYEPVDLAALTTDLASSFRSAIEKAGLTFTVDCSPLPEPVYVDRELWEKILLNLLSNAFKYTFTGGITVTLRQKASTVEVSVTDTGVGIPAEELPHMFERFHRVAGNEGRSHEGTGIGLSFVQELVKLHGGTIRVTSAPGEGSTFTISLPLGTAHLPPDRITTRPVSSSTTAASHFLVDEALRLLPGHEEAVVNITDVSFPFSSNKYEGARILFADDNPDMRTYVSRLLRTHYDVRVVADGEAALAAVKDYQPDLVLTDIMMPKMDGFSLLHALRADHQSRTLPVILLSARAGEEAIIEGMEAGADDYLIKPFSARELLARVRAHLEIARLRAEAEQSVKAERQRLHDLFMQAPAAVVILRGSTHQIELANPTALKIWGRTNEEVLNKSLFDALPEVRGQGLEQLLDGVLTTGVPCIGRELHLRLDRHGNGKLEDTYFTFVYAPLRGRADAIEGIMVFAYEVTDQVIARRKVEESEERFRTLADNMSQFAWMTDETGWIFWYNQRWYDYTGTSLKDVEGWKWQSLLHPDHLTQVVEKLRHCFQKGEVWEDTFQLRGKDGIYCWFLSRAVPIRDEQGKIIRWFGTNTDVTEQKRLEQQKDEFIGIASHELKTPVTSLKAYTQLLERRFRQGDDLRSAELVRKMDAQINKLTGLVEDLLDVTKIENGQLVFHFSSFDFNTLVQEVVEEIQRSSTRHLILLELASSVTLYADRDRISQVLINLLTNAIKYSPRAETILVKTVLTDNAVITSVQDFGIGIAKEKQAEIFKRFFRVEGETQATYPGLGLGLYISAEFVKRHHGSISVESEEGQGTTFSFSLPLHNTIEGEKDR